MNIVDLASSANEIHKEDDSKYTIFQGKRFRRKTEGYKKKMAMK